jgi:hypothetical protein
MMQLESRFDLPAQTRACGVTWLDQTERAGGAALGFGGEVETARQVRWAFLVEIGMLSNAGQGVHHHVHHPCVAHHTKHPARRHISDPGWLPPAVKSMRLPDLAASPPTEGVVTMNEVGWEFWILRAAIVGAFGVALVLIDRLFARVQNWLTWLLRFSVLFGLSVLAVAFDWSLLMTSSGATATGLWFIGGVGMVVGLFGIPISFVRWVDTWDHGLLKTKPRPKEPAAEGDAPASFSNEQIEDQTVPQHSIDEARLKLVKAVDLANEISLIDRLYAVANQLTDLHALIEADDDLDNPDDEDYPMSCMELNITRYSLEQSLEVGFGDHAFVVTFTGNNFAPKLDECCQVSVRHGHHIVAALDYEPATGDAPTHRKWRATDVTAMDGTAWLAELEHLAKSYVERGKLFERYRLRKSREAEENDVIERAKKIRLDD